MSIGDLHVRMKRSAMGQSSSHVLPISFFAASALSEHTIEMAFRIVLLSSCHVTEFASKGHQTANLPCHRIDILIGDLSSTSGRSNWSSRKGHVHYVCHISLLNKLQEWLLLTLIPMSNTCWRTQWFPCWTFPVLHKIASAQIQILMTVQGLASRFRPASQSRASPQVESSLTVYQP